MDRLVKRLDVKDEEPLYINLYLPENHNLEIGNIYPVKNNGHMKITQAKVVSINGSVVRMELLRNG